MVEKYIDTLLKYDENEIPDIVIEDNDIKLDNSFATSLIVDLNTDSYVYNYNIGNRGGCVGIEFGSDLWTLITHKRMDDETINKIINKINDILYTYEQLNVWERHKLEKQDFADGSIKLKITTYNSGGNQQNIYYIPYTKITENL